MEIFKPQHIERWHETVNYDGSNFDHYYVASWRFFRCSPTERANFNYIKQQVLGCFEDHRAALEDNVVVLATFTDEVMKQRYYILIHESQTRALKMADMLVKRARTKGSLDPDNEQTANMSAVTLTWRKSELKKRVQYCVEAGVSIFAARRKEFPEGENGVSLFDLLSEIV